VTGDQRPPGLRTASLRRRGSLLVLGLLVALLVVLGVSVDLALDARLHADLRNRLSDRAEIAATLVRQGRSDQQVIRAVTGGTVQALIETPAGDQLGALPEPPGPAPRLRAEGRAAGAPARPKAGKVVDTGSAYVLQERLPDGSRLTLVADQSSVTDTVARLRLVLLTAAAVVLVLAAASVSGTVGIALRPLARMTEVARSISSGDRGRRLRPDRPGTELGRTATAFDAMLDELEGAERKAQRAEEGMRDLLSDAAHELRTPLAAVSASLETVLRTDPPRERREELVAAALRELGRSGRLVRDLLDVARLDAGQGLALRPVDADLRDLVDRSVGRLPATGPHPVVSGGPVPVRVDPDRIGQVLDNLLRNAVQAAGPGGAVQVGVARAADGTAQVDVVDDGPGVPEPDRERVFERLVRLDGARSRDGGAGLGLPIARGLARASGGDVGCLASSRGAHFRLRLPAPPPSG